MEERCLRMGSSRAETRHCQKANCELREHPQTRTLSAGIWKAIADHRKLALAIFCGCEGSLLNFEAHFEGAARPGLSLQSCLFGRKRALFGLSRAISQMDIDGVHMHLVSIGDAGSCPNSRDLLSSCWGGNTRSGPWLRAVKWMTESDPAPISHWGRDSKPILANSPSVVVHNSSLGDWPGCFNREHHALPAKATGRLCKPQAARKADRSCKYRDETAP